MISWGKDRKGKQRYRCILCQTTERRVRKDTRIRNQKKVQNAWLGTTTSLTDLGKKHHVTRQTLCRRFAAIPEDMVCLSTEFSPVLIVDATWITNRTTLLFLVIQGVTHIPVVSHHGNKETYDQWMTCLKLIPYKPECIICDGHKGLKKAILATFGDILIQRCLVHVLRFVTTKTTQRPRTVAGKELLFIMSFLCRIRTRDQADRWLLVYHAWRQKHYEFLQERTLVVSGKSFYTHKSLRSARYHIDHARDHLFVYLELPCDHTTNAVEGGYNARIAELLHNHRGISDKNKRKLIARYIHIRTQSNK